MKDLALFGRQTARPAKVSEGAEAARMVSMDPV